MNPIRSKRPLTRTLPSLPVFALIPILFGCSNLPTTKRVNERPPRAVEPHETKPSVPTAPSSAESEENDISKEFVRLSWSDAFAFVKERTNWLSEGDDPRTIDEVKTRLCVQSSGDASAPPEPAVCDGPVWRISFEHLHYSDRTLVLLPVDDEVIVYDAGMIGGGACWGSQSSSLLALEIAYETPKLTLTFTEESYEFTPETNECKTSSKSVTEIRYDAKSGRGTLRERAE